VAADILFEFGFNFLPIKDHPVVYFKAISLILGRTMGIVVIRFSFGILWCRSVKVRQCRIDKPKPPVRVLHKDQTLVGVHHGSHEVLAVNQAFFPSSYDL